MAQSNALLRFRARLRSRGYTDITIRRAINLAGEGAYGENGQELWFVRCTEPLLGYEASFVCTEEEMNNWPGICLDRNGVFTKQLDFFDGDGIFV